jgi:Ca2+-binding RTX toxin-like protein
MMVRHRPAVAPSFAGPNASAAARPAAVEPLEDRRLFAVTAGIDAAGRLVVRGTSQADAITLTTLPAANAQPARIRVVAAGLDAKFAASAVKAVTVNAGDGSDVVNAAGVDRPTVLNGGAGNDTLTSGPAADALNGGDGDDTLDAGLGSDFLSGGDGSEDRATYAARTAAVTASLDNVANDGVAGEKDDVRSDVEQLVGGGGSDTLTGDAAINLLIGNGGNDTLYGKDGEDALFGNAGNDQLYGQGGIDTLDGGIGTDYLSGGNGYGDVVNYGLRTVPVNVSLDGVNNDGAAGEKDFVAADIEAIIGGSAADTLTGDAGSNFIYGGAGDDLIRGGGGNDLLIGDAGRDRLYGQAGDDALVGADSGEPDYVDGGTGSDLGQLDDADAYFSIESFIV